MKINELPDGRVEYGFAVTGEEAERSRMETEVLRDLIAFVQANPALDLSAVELVEGPKIGDRFTRGWYTVV